MDTIVLTWIGIALCLLQSGLFSGLNLAAFSVSRLRLEIEHAAGNKHASKVLGLRQNSNLLLATILWGNVASNTLLAILANSVMAGVVAFLFSTFVITFAGEIFPQAYFSRNALRMASLSAPILGFYEKLLYPVTKPTGMLLDALLGAEGVQYLRERDLRVLLEKHVEATEAEEVGHFEGMGALNFLALDDLPAREEGEPLDPKSVVELPVTLDLPVFPDIDRNPQNAFLRRIQESGKKWVVIVDPNQMPRLIVNADSFIREALFGPKAFDPYSHCHRPIVVHKPDTPIGHIVRKLKVRPTGPADDVIDDDIILVWSQDERRIITGADILGRLLRGIVERIPDKKGRR